MVLAFGEQQALADERPEALHGDPFSEGAFRVDQDAPHVVRVVELPDGQMEKAEGAHVSVGRRVVLQERDRIVVGPGERPP